jgi:spore maturation protein CgeB
MILIFKKLVRELWLYQYYKSKQTDQVFTDDQDYYELVLENKSLTDHELNIRFAADRIKKKIVSDSLNIMLYLPGDGWEFFSILPQLKRISNTSVCMFDKLSSKEDFFIFLNKKVKKNFTNIFITDVSVQQYLDKKTVAQINNKNIITIFINLDDDVKFSLKNSYGNYIGPRANASEVDLYLTSSKNSIKKYVSEGGRAVFMPEGANPYIFKPLKGVENKYDVVFIGQIYGVRRRLVKMLKSAGIKITVFGKGSANGIPSFKEMNKIWNKSKIVLGHGGIEYSWNTRNLKGRDFEVISSGACYITTYHPELKEIFKEGEQILFYDDVAECINKIKILLENPNEIDKIKEGARLVSHEHTWEKRFRDVFTELGLLK